MKDIFEWNRIFFNDLPKEFIFEVIFRSMIMFIAVLVILKLTGRRGVRQLSIFELVVIITLGSAAGDPMFYEDVGIIPAVCVLITILLLYRALTWGISRFPKFENWIEGKPIYIIENGKFNIKVFEKQDIVIDEFFSELRQKNIDHLGQVKLAILETSGEVSVFFFDEEHTLVGLPILPHEYENCFHIITEENNFACTFCGNVEYLKPTSSALCSNCGKHKWIKARKNKRIA